MDKENNKSIREEIAAAIKRGEITMRPRWHFILKTLLAAFGGIFLILALLFTVSFVIFALHQTGAWFVPIFGLHGMRVFLMSMPWLLLFIALVFIAVLEILVKRYSFAYRRPLLYSALAIVLFALIGGFVVAQTQFHRGLLRSARENKLPFGGPLYRGFGMQRFKNVHRGVIVSKTDKGFVMETGPEETLSVSVTPETRFPLGTNFAEGDIVVVFGERAEDSVEAIGIRKIDDEFDHMPGRMPGSRSLKPPRVWK